MPKEDYEKDDYDEEIEEKSLPPNVIRKKMIKSVVKTLKKNNPWDNFYIYPTKDRKVLVKDYIKSMEEVYQYHPDMMGLLTDIYQMLYLISVGHRDNVQALKAALQLLDELEEENKRNKIEALKYEHDFNEQQAELEQLKKIVENKTQILDEFVKMSAFKIKNFENFMDSEFKRMKDEVEPKVTPSAPITQEILQMIENRIKLGIKKIIDYGQFEILSIQRNREDMLDKREGIPSSVKFLFDIQVPHPREKEIAELESEETVKNIEMSLNKESKYERELIEEILPDAIARAKEEDKFTKRWLYNFYHMNKNRLKRDEPDDWLWKSKIIEKHIKEYIAKHPELASEQKEITSKDDTLELDREEKIENA